MKKGSIVLIAIVVLVAFAVPAMADTIFNEMSKSIATWKCPTKCEPAKATAATVKTTVNTTASAVTTTTDALGNIVSTGTVK